METKQTTEQAYTPGPWSVYEPINGQTFGIDGANGDAVVFFGTYPNTSIPRIEDARLIAAAPELLAWAQKHAFNTHRGTLMLDIVDVIELQNIVAKATGSAA